MAAWVALSARRLHNVWGRRSAAFWRGGRIREVAGGHHAGRHRVR